MPIEIKELVIRAVTYRELREKQRAARDPRLGPDPEGSASGAPPIDKTAIIEAAVKEVLRVLRAEKER